MRLWAARAWVHYLDDPSNRVRIHCCLLLSLIQNLLATEGADAEQTADSAHPERTDFRSEDDLDMVVVAAGECNMRWGCMCCKIVSAPGWLGCIMFTSLVEAFVRVFCSHLARCYALQPISFIEAELSDPGRYTTNYLDNLRMTWRTLPFYPACKCACACETLL